MILAPWKLIVRRDSWCGAQVIEPVRNHRNPLSRREKLMAKSVKTFENRLQ